MPKFLESAPPLPRTRSAGRGYRTADRPITSLLTKHADRFDTADAPLAIQLLQTELQFLYEEVFLSGDGGFRSQFRRGHFFGRIDVHTDIHKLYLQTGQSEARGLRVFEEFLTPLNFLHGATRCMHRKHHVRAE